ncbi:MAG: hypothetical protein GY851_14680 [bacterium]|nr:hypothetical protein [bacterium]
MAMSKRRSLCSVAIIVFGLTFAAEARNRPCFGTHVAAWNADQIVVVRVGLTLEVLETWRGDLAPGDQLEVPHIRIIDRATHDAVAASISLILGELGSAGGVYGVPRHDRHGVRIGSCDLGLLDGTKAVLFLRNPDETTHFATRPDKTGQKPTTTLAALLPERSRVFTRFLEGDEVIPGSVTWFFDGHVIGLRQTLTVAPPVPCPQRYFESDGQTLTPYTKATFRAEVDRVVAMRERFDNACAIQDADDRMHAIRPFYDTDVSPARTAVQEAVAEYVALLLDRVEAMPDQTAAEKELLDFVKSDLFVPSAKLVWSLKEGSSRVVPSLYHILDRPEWSMWHSCAAHSLGTVLGPGPEADLVELLDEETAFWRGEAGDLSPGWMRGASADTIEAHRELQRHYSLTYVLLDGLMWSAADREEAVRAFWEVWKTIPAPYDLDSKRDVVHGAYQAVVRLLAAEHSRKQP